MYLACSDTNRELEENPDFDRKDFLEVYSFMSLLLGVMTKRGESRKHLLFRVLVLLSLTTCQVTSIVLPSVVRKDENSRIVASVSGTHRGTVFLFGWLEDFFEPPKSNKPTRQLQYPEQYPATYERNELQLDEDEKCSEAKLLRPLLKNTQLESRPLEIVYDANRAGWNPTSFHSCVDGKGAAIVVARTQNGQVCGGYNPKGWASLGGARPSVAAFLFYEPSPGTFQKLQKVGGGGLACARDDPGFGISFGPDGLVISLQSGRDHLAQSKLGPYFECGPQKLSSLFGGVTELVDLKVLVGKYKQEEEIPYSGGVLDMTSG